MRPLPLDFLLETERLRLHMPSESDIPEVFEASRFPRFNDGMLWDPPATLEELRGPYERAHAAWRESRSYQFSIYSSEEFVGRIALRPTDQPGVLDVGYWTHPRHQGRGYMTEALRAVVALGFETMEAQAIVACYATWNEGSRRVLAANGFQTVRVCPGGFMKHDRISDEAHARLDRSAWRTPDGRTPPEA